MIKTTLNPKIIHSFKPTEVDDSLVAYIKQNGWKDIPPIPVFEIPQELREDGFEYVLADGCHRREAAIALNQESPVAIYNPTEKIDPTRDNLAPFRHHNDPRLYEKLIFFYTKRKELTLENVLGKPHRNI